MQQWTDMNETEQTFAQIPQLSHFNPVELSLIHLSHFPTLVSPGVTTGTKARSSSVSSPPLTPTQALVSPSSSTLSTSHPVLTGASPAAASADALSNGSRLSFFFLLFYAARVACGVSVSNSSPVAWTMQPPIRSCWASLRARVCTAAWCPGTSSRLSCPGTSTTSYFMHRCSALLCSRPGLDCRLTIDGVSTDLYSVEAMLAGTPPQKKEVPLAFHLLVCSRFVS